jgi:hypothetical protein
MDGSFDKLVEAYMNDRKFLIEDILQEFNDERINEIFS